MIKYLKKYTIRPQEVTFKCNMCGKGIIYEHRHLKDEDHYAIANEAWLCTGCRIQQIYCKLELVKHRAIVIADECDILKAGLA